MERELVQQAKELEGTITLGCGETMSTGALARMCASFQRQHPRVSFDFYTAGADELIERMEHGLIDLGLLLTPVEVSRFNYLVVPQKERWVALLRADDPLAVQEAVAKKDLLQGKVILPRRLHVQSTLAHWFGRDFRSLNVSAYSNLTTNAAAMVENGLGRALCIESSAPHWDPSRIVLKPLAPAIETESLLVWKRDRYFSLATEQFISFIEQELENHKDA